ncbi:MAG TPA: hypothetical protein VF814_20350 [Casimicrobiaceae bacterium]
MCYEFSEWSWKLRAAELARKQRETGKASKKESKPAPAPEPAAPEAPIKDRETVPA